MFEKVNKYHPDKLADRIAGAMLDIAYAHQDNPKVAIEVLVGHSFCHIIAESSYTFTQNEVDEAVARIVPFPVAVDLLVVPQDPYLAANQNDGPKCGDNGIFKGVPLTWEEKELTYLASVLEERYPYDGKYLIDRDAKKLIICQSNITEEENEALKTELEGIYSDYTIVVNPLGSWTGGINTDSGVTNRKLGSDMAQSVTGGGLHGKDLSKADISTNIYAFVKAQETGKLVEFSCAIGDEIIGGKPYSEIVDFAHDYIQSLGGFEAFSEYGLVR